MGLKRSALLGKAPKDCSQEGLISASLDWLKVCILVALGSSLSDSKIEGTGKLGDAWGSVKVMFYSGRADTLLNKKNWMFFSWFDAREFYVTTSIMWSKFGKANLVVAAGEVTGLR